MGMGNRNRDREWGWIMGIGIGEWGWGMGNGRGKKGPPPRSIYNLLALTINGKEELVTLFGELEPSKAGHKGAGKMWGMYGFKGCGGGLGGD